MRIKKLYIETSVWNYLFADDIPQKKVETEEFFEYIAKSGHIIYISTVVLDEISAADEEKQKLLRNEIEKYRPSILEINDDVKSLAEEYILKGAIPRRKPADALHCALSSFYEVDVLVTWNFAHLANITKRDKISGVNLELGYRILDIAIPPEVKDYES